MITKQHSPFGSTLTLGELDEQLHPSLHRLRQAEPIAWVPSLQAWLVTSYDECVQIMRDATTFTVDHPGFSTAQVIGSSMLSLDGDTHLRHRLPFEHAFRKRAVLDRFTKQIVTQANTLIDGFGAHGQAELRREFAGRIAVHTMLVTLGIEHIGVNALLQWYDAIVDAVTQVTAGQAVSADGQQAFDALQATLLPALQQDPSSSLLAAASDMAQTLTAREIVSNAAVLLFGGIETTEGMIVNALYHLLSYPDWMATLREAPDYLPNAIEESLRLEPAASVVDRYATRDVILGGAFIEAGDLVRVSLAGANRDPSVWANPDEFNPMRDNLRSHLTFAQGAHVCLGLHLARLEAHEALQPILERLHGIRFADDRARAEAHPRGLVFRKSPSLRVRWDVGTMLY